MVGLSVIPCLGSAKKNQEDELLRHKPSYKYFKGLQFPDPVSGFRLGRKAAHVAKTIAQLSVYGDELLANEIAHFPPNYLSSADTPYQNFGSRKIAFEKLWKALVNENGHPVLGLYGMPGVGKSRMMEEAFKQAMKNKIFSTVTRAIVGGGKEIDVKDLQTQLAHILNCHLESEDVVLRASKLKDSLMKGGKTLIMLDDFWEVVPLESIGIPFGDDSSKGCKIFFTSRRQDVCLLNNCKDPIEIKTLDENEALEMFRTTVGSSKIEDLDDASLAKKVCKQCGGLPLLIYEIGEQLKVLTEDSWKDAFQQLENSKLEQVDIKVYRSLEMSFTRLSEGPKTCLLLCSLFLENADIEIKMPFDLATGAQLLDSKENFLRCIDILKSSSLLHEGGDGCTVKMNGIVRDVARYIAARDPQYGFLYLRCSVWSPDIADYHKMKILQLHLERDNVLFPDDLVYPHLHTLWLQCNNHTQQHLSGYFNGFINLRSLVIRSMRTSQQLSVHNLDKLRVFILDGCDVNQIFLNSIPKNLETLSIRDSHLPSPIHLPQLKNLRKLELFSQTQIEMVAETVSRLSRIQEMNIPGGIKTWDDAGSLYSLLLSLYKLYVYTFKHGIHYQRIN